MPDEIILDAPYAVVRADQTVPCLVVQLRAFANREQFKHLMRAGLAYYKAHSQPALGLDCRYPSHERHSAGGATVAGRRVE